MSQAYRIHGARYLRKYSAEERSSIYAYMADVRKIANTLCEVPWTRVKNDVAATTTIHTEEGLDWNEPERDRFDAAEWCGEHSDGFHRAFAQAACYVFRMPASAIGTAVEKISVQVTSDAYNPYGARIAAMTSATLDIPTDCATVREGEVFRAPDEDGMGAAPRLYMRNRDGSQNWYSNTERVDLEPADQMTCKQYLFVFACLENYNRGRDGWIEGSSYIDNDVVITLGTACADLDENELNDLSGINTRAIGYCSSHDDGFVKLADAPENLRSVSWVLDDDEMFAAVGAFGQNSLSVVPGWVLYDGESGGIVDLDPAYEASTIKLKQEMVNFYAARELVGVGITKQSGGEGTAKRYVLEFRYAGLVTSNCMYLELTKSGGVYAVKAVVASRNQAIGSFGMDATAFSAMIAVDRAGNATVRVDAGIAGYSKPEDAITLPVAGGRIFGAYDLRPAGLVYASIVYGSFTTLNGVQTGNVAKVTVKIGSSGSLESLSVEPVVGPGFAFGGVGGRLGVMPAVRKVYRHDPEGATSEEQYYYERFPAIMAFGDFATVGGVTVAGPVLVYVHGESGADGEGRVLPLGGIPNMDFVEAQTVPEVQNGTFSGRLYGVV